MVIIHWCFMPSYKLEPTEACPPSLKYRHILLLGLLSLCLYGCGGSSKGPAEAARPDPNGPANLEAIQCLKQELGVAPGDNVRAGEFNELVRKSALAILKCKCSERDVEVYLN